MKKLILLAALAAAPYAASAACSCACVNGQVRPICQNAYDPPPVCAPQVCQIVPPSVAPIQTPMVPPVGTSNCQQVQVFNQYTGQYQWRTLCR
jgi:hypothetical protein